MQSNTLAASDGAAVQYYSWLLDNPSAAIQINHGMGEHAARYDEVAGHLNDAGYAVYAADHRGHGVTGAANLGYMGGDGWNRVLADTYELNRVIAAAHPGLPIVMLGHSMGSMLSQQYITRYGRSIDQLVLSGSPGFKDPKLALLPKLVARFESWRLGPEQASERLQSLLFGGANKPFDGPGASGFEWLSRDAAAVQAYLDDPQCGFVLSAGSLYDLYNGAAAAMAPVNLQNIPKELPVYVFSGADDPVHGECKDLNRMIQAYRDAGISNLEYKYYPGGRHEMFNETNRDEVLADLVTWLRKQQARRVA